MAEAVNAYYLANKDKVKAVAIDNGSGCVMPGAETVADSTYQPLSRPMFAYFNKSAASRPEVKALARLYVAPESADRVKETGYMPLPTALLLTVGRRLENGMTGTAFGGKGAVVGVTTDDLEDENRIKNALVQ
ncbi:MAG TPA: hypothetical protein VNZ26_14085 [Vicinamibacterales bacterium]|jgi:phosphate transport system substrate-binding protein|nr:hypothetical protein [Vicinamibacterales bacterium]